MLPVKIIGIHALEDEEHLIHGIEHHMGAHPIPFQVTWCTHLTIICRHLKVSKIFIYMPPKMPAVSAKHGIEALSEDGVKCVNENQVI